MEYKVKKFSPRTHRVALLCILVCAFSAKNTSAQFHIDSWTTGNGLPQNSVNSIIQTRDGFLWLATFGGLVRYDGVTFKVFNPGNTKGLKSSRFLKLFEDREGQLWITTENAGVTRYKDGVFNTYTTDDGLPNNSVLDVFYDREGSLLLDTPEALIQWREGRITPYSQRDGEFLKRPIHRSASRAVWHYDGEKLFKYEGGQQTLAVATSFHVTRMFEDHRGRLWLGTREDKLVVFQNGEFTIFPVPGVTKVVLNKVYEDRQRNLWFGLTGSGLLRLKDAKLTRYTATEGLASNDVNSIYEDREGNLWVGTTGGLSRFKNRVMTSYSADNGLSANNTYPVYEDRQGAIWIGSWRGLTVYKDGTFARTEAQFDLSNKMIMSLMEDRAGGFWVGTWGDGVKLIKDGKTTSFLPRDDIPIRIVRAIYEDRAGNIWFGANNGLVKYAGGAFTLFTKKDGLSGNTVYLIFEDRAGVLWFGTEAGLTRYSNGAFNSYTEQDGLSGNNVRAIYEDAEGTIWIGTYDAGITRLKAGKSTRYTTKDGLFDNGAFQIFEDARGYFWVGCNRGIYRVARKELNDFAGGHIRRITSVPYGKEDGMLNAECNGGAQPAGVKARDGKLWFPTQQGVTVVDPEAVAFNKQPPPVVIEEFVVGRDAISFSNGVKISPGQESFEIHYAGLSFIKPEQVKFKYKLSGLDVDWVDAETRRIAYYTHLPPGRYKFTVVAANTDGVWNWEGASVEIVVVPPFWRTWWFTTLIAAALTAIAIAIYKHRTGRLRQAHAAREAISRKLIDTQEKERRRIAAELHDSLGQNLIVIRNWALLGLSTIEEDNSSAERLREISTTASQAINEVREIAYNLGPYQLDRLGLTKTIEDMVEKVSASSRIPFSFEAAQLDGVLSKEGEINLYRVIQEAVSNTVKHSGATRVMLTIGSESRHLLVIIRDNGKGFSPRTPHNGGFGLVGIAERVRILGGKWEIDSAPGQGTTVTIRVPFLNGFVAGDDRNDN